MDVKISELPESEGLKAGCCFPVVTDEVTYKVTFQQIKSQILEAVYPVGSIWISINPTNPAEVFGGSWERIEGRFLLGSDETHPLNTIGGEATHKLTIDEMPAHSHKINFDQIWNFGGTLSIGTTGAGRYDGQGYVQNEGGNQPHNNMPPYLSVYMWKRIF